MAKTPHNVRNYWLEADIDGRRTRLEGGPQAREGGFALTVYMRDRGGIIKALEVNGFGGGNGVNRLEVRAVPTVDGYAQVSCDWQTVAEIRTERNAEKPAKVTRARILDAHGVIPATAYDAAPEAGR